MYVNTRLCPLSFHLRLPTGTFAAELGVCRYCGVIQHWKTLGRSFSGKPRPLDFRQWLPLRQRPLTLKVFLSYGEHGMAYLHKPRLQSYCFHRDSKDEHLCIFTCPASLASIPNCTICSSKIIITFTMVATV